MRRRSFLSLLLGAAGCPRVHEPKDSTPPMACIIRRTIFSQKIVGRFCRSAATAHANWYVSNDGDDDNDGRSPATPFATMARLDAAAVEQGDFIYLERDSMWREQFPTEIAAGITILDYGDGDRPSIDARDVALNASFVKTAGRTNIYEIPWTHDFDASGGKTMHRAWESDSMMRRAAAPDAVLADALTTLDGMPGAFWAATPTTGGPDTIYIHAAGSTSPITNGVEYQFTKRAWCISLFNSENRAEVYSIHLRGNAQADGSLVLDGHAQDCVMQDGRIHNALIRGSLRDCIANHIEPHHGGIPGGATMYVAYFDGTSPWMNERDTAFYDCEANAQSGMLSAGGATNRSTTIGYYAHTTGFPTHAWRTLYYESSTATNCLTAFATDNAVNAVYYKCGTIEGCRYGVSGTAETIVILGGSWFMEGDDPLFVNFQSDIGVPNTIIIRGARVAVDEPGEIGPVWINLDGTSVSITRCTFFMDGGVFWLDDGDFVFEENIFYGEGLRLGRTGEALPPYSGSSNLYWIPGHDEAVFQTFNSPPTNYLTLADWQAFSSQDLDSEAADPLFAGDPMAGDFTVSASSPAHALHAGADYEGEDADAVLQGLLTQYAGSLDT